MILSADYAEISSWIDVSRPLNDSMGSSHQCLTRLWIINWISLIITCEYIRHVKPGAGAGLLTPLERSLIITINHLFDFIMLVIRFTIYLSVTVRSCLIIIFIMCNLYQVIPWIWVHLMICSNPRHWLELSLLTLIKVQLYSFVKILTLFPVEK